ncbi:acyl-CoA thioesterase [Winogradskyella vincentii]|uniref:Acyl-CoA thioesterase n=1 Tax=Winogradskyella vincentii TaxID=2877122 RepID=A0ABS7XYR8_9FLAO|nr:thioesterase family protein [Winogradskyella vincentii]MCA0152813.1 acyl-CoA thioesterase [Winogradskyella vincentii]
MQIFEKTITVAQEDLDQLNHVNNVRYVQWVQDIAEAHWMLRAPKQILDNYFWVLVRHTIDYKNQAVLGDILKLKTYVLNSEGVTSVRMVEIFNASTNRLLVKSETKWCFMDKKTYRPTRILAEVANLFD